MRYVRPPDLEQALAALDEGAVVLAGGSVLVPLIARGEAAPTVVVDVGRLAPLRELTDNGGLSIGAAVTLEELEGLTPAGEAALPEASARVGNPLVRRIATLGGNVASRLPHADLVPALLVLDAEVVSTGAAGEERRSVAEMLRGSARPGRIVTAVRIDRDPKRRSGFLKFAWRRSTGGAVASVAFAARRGDGAVAEPRLAVGGLVAPTRLESAESLLAGCAWGDAPVDEVAAAASDEAADRARLAAGDLRRRLVALGVRRLLERVLLA
jgi:CO/xanthine dehydrogenase FAD-binding subunit